MIPIEMAYTGVREFAQRKGQAMTIVIRGPKPGDVDHDGEWR